MHRHVTARTNYPTVILMSRSLHLFILRQTHHTQPLIYSVRFPLMIALKKKGGMPEGMSVSVQGCARAWAALLPSWILWQASHVRC